MYSQTSWMMSSLEECLLLLKNSRPIFIGGIHGVGKSTLCSKVCSEFNIPHLVAGDVIRKFKEANSIHHVDQGKHVEDIPVNQDILISALNETAIDYSNYVLDGHFTLFDRLGAIHPVPMSTFSIINPVVLFVVVDKPESICSRLLSRDEDTYCPKVLGDMQDAEVTHAFEVAKDIGIQAHQVSPASFSFINEIIGELNK